MANFSSLGRWSALMLLVAVAPAMVTPSRVAATPLPAARNHQTGLASTLSRAGDEGTSRISVGPAGRQANNESFDAAVSASGRYVAFSSEATNLVPGDSNDAFDVFVRDRRTDVTSRVSLRSGGKQGNSHSSDPAISGDGRYVAFTSSATNLVAGDTNRALDVFVHDRYRRVTSRVSVGPGGRQGASTDRRPISYADTAISADGRYIAFTSTATNLVAHDTNKTSDVFVHDRRTGVTHRVSVSSAEREGDRPSLFPGISGDGHFIVFASLATTLVKTDENAKADVFVRDQRKGTTSLISAAIGKRPSNGDSLSPTISGNGRYVAYTSDGPNLVAGDTNGGADVFVHDRRLGTTSRVSVGPHGTQAQPGNQPNAFFLETALSGDGRYIALTSAAANLVLRDRNKTTDVFQRDRRTGVTSRISVGTAEREGNGESLFPAISADGRYAAFASDSSNLVPGDTNGTSDVFVHRPR